MPLITGVLQTRGATALVVRGDDGLDELSTTGHSRIREVSAGAVTEHDVHPSDVGLPVADGGPARRHSGGERGDGAPGAGGGGRARARHRAAERGGGLVAWDLSLDPSQAERPMAKRLSDGIERAARAIDAGRAPPSWTPGSPPRSGSAG